MLKVLQPEKVELGMYINGFKGKWLSHPFWRSKFIVDSEHCLSQLRNGGVEVVIDSSKGVDISDIPSGRRELRTPLAHAPNVTGKQVGSRRPSKVRPAATREQPLRAFGKSDKARAIALAERSTKVVKALFEECRLGRSVPTSQIFAIVDDIVDLLEQNTLALINVTRLKAKDDATFTHSVAVCALMINLARENGASPTVLRTMGVAGLLHDIGKILIDENILKKGDPLTSDEVSNIRQHPGLGRDLLAQVEGLPPICLDVCLHHHERLDGSGYPFGLKGEHVSQGARIAAICDVYDAMTSDRPYRQGITPARALIQMEREENKFDPDLLFRFMRSIAVFPPNKLLRLRSNRLAIALPMKNLESRPIARAFYSTIETSFMEYEDIVISDSLNGEQAVSAEDPAKWFSDEWSGMLEKITTGKRLRP